MTRRGLLLTEANPDSRIDYVITLGEHTPSPGRGETAVGLRYVPDKLIVDPASLARYLRALSGLTWGSLEALAVTVRDDVNNEVVPRWLQVTVSAPEGQRLDLGEHSVMLEDRQPRWDNPALLSRLRRG